MGVRYWVRTPWVALLGYDTPWVCVIVLGHIMCVLHWVRTLDLRHRVRTPLVCVMEMGHTMGVRY
jgi:hypothetical protein